MRYLPDEWASAFQPETPLLELAVRGSVLYFAILLLMRIMPRRTGGELATMDLIFVILIAEAGAHSMGDYTSLADGVVMVLTLIAWNYLVNALSYHVPLVERLVSSPPLQVVRDGELLLRNMRREFLTREELMSHLREQGIDDLAGVKSAFVEGEGKLTVIRKGD